MTLYYQVTEELSQNTFKLGNKGLLIYSFFFREQGILVDLLAIFLRFLANM